jgi:hypothetical protein
LGVNWEARIVESYIALFERLREVIKLPFRDLTFENFAGLGIPPAKLGVRPGDRAD